MSGLELLIPMVFSAVGSAAAAVSSVAMSAGAAIFGAGAMSGIVGTVLTGAIGHGLVGGVIGGAISAISGGDFMDGFSSGAISGGIMGGVGASGILGDIMGTGSASSGAASAADSLLEPVVSTPMNASMSSLMETGGIGGAAGSIPAAVNPIDSAFSGFGAPASSGAANASVGGAASNGAAGAIDFVQSTPSPVIDKMVGGGGGGGAFDGFFSDREIIGGAISGVGKVLSGDTARAGAEANNQGAMDRQVQAQQNTAANYDISTGLMPDGARADPGAGRPTPTQQFGANQQGQSGAWEYYFDPATKTIKRRAMSMA